VHRILLRHGLVREQDRHAQAVKRFERSAANQLWQMDFKSPVGWESPVGPWSLLDDHSRYAIALRGTWTTRAEAVKPGLMEAFERCGVPEEMLMDHGRPWFNTQGRLGWSQLTVWLVERDIVLYFSGCRHPQTQGKVERFHRSLTAALLRRGASAEDRIQQWLDAFRYEYNRIRPHEALQMKTPHQIWQRSTRPYQEKPPRWEYAEGAKKWI
jgi:transposase InsO family protein